MNETSRQPPSDEVPPGDEPQPLRTEEHARIAKLVAEEALIQEQLKRAKIETKAAEREAKAWHTRYTFVPSPRVALQAIGAGVVLVIAFFVFYQPLVDRIKFDAEEEAKIEKRKAQVQEFKAEMQLAQNQKISQLLDEQKNQLKAAKQELQAQEERYTNDLKNLADRLKESEENFKETVQLAQKWKTQLQERTSEYERLAKLAETSETEKARFQKLASQEKSRAQELAQQLASLQTKARTASEQAAKVQKEVEARPGRVFRDKLKDGSEGPEMIILAAGNFLMGSPSLQRSVIISRPFALSIHEITFAEYDIFAKDSGRQRPDDEGWGRGDRPVINVSWEEATAYAQWLSEQTGQDYRLPTEAEWEYAARAGSTTAYSFGDDPSRLGEYAWFESNSGGKTHSVGQKMPNAWGLYDMHGNVWEWCQDWYKEYPSSPVTDPKGPTESVFRAFRGGSWRHDARSCRSAYRAVLVPDRRSDRLGFRLARSVVLGS